MFTAEDNTEGAGCCDWLLWIFSVLLIIITLPFSLFLSINLCLQLNIVLQLNIDRVYISILIVFSAEDNTEGAGCCGWLLWIFSVLLIIITLPFSLVLTIKVSTVNPVCVTI